MKKSNRNHRFSSASLARVATIVATLLLASSAPALAKSGKSPAPVADGVVNINAASPDQLRLLPGIGATKAKRIVSYRAKRKFRATHELVRVKGIGRRTYRKLKPYLALSGPTTLTRKVTSRRQ